MGVVSVLLISIVAIALQLPLGLTLPVPHLLATERQDYSEADVVLDCKRRRLEEMDTGEGEVERGTTAGAPTIYPVVSRGMGAVAR